LRALAAHLSRVADSLTISRQAAIDALGTMRANGYDDTDVDAFTISDIGGGQLRGYLLTRDGLLPGDAMAHADHICETTGSAMFGGPAGSRAQRAYYATTTRYDGE
jgi:hypothetical protein